MAKGYGATTVGEIAKEARVSKKTCYKYAVSKADLFRIVVTEALSLLQVNFSDEFVEDGSARALRAFLEPIAELALSYDGLRFFRMIVRDASNFPEMMSAYQDATVSLSTGIVQWMERRKQSGWIENCTAPVAARTMMTLLLAETRIGFLIGARQAPVAAERRLILHQAVDLFLRALGPNSGRSEIA